ncbi:MAG: glycosyltransferase [Thaumarchaeota archaeon]|nr:glycosyltransferase [Nitrososphaerota archaeon]
MIKYSICITHYNNNGTVRGSLDSLLDQLDDTFEVVVVDNMSNDGSQLVLEEYGKMGAIRLISAKCSRGKGRQIAFLNSVGDYVVSNMDMDEVFKPTLASFLTFYHNRCEGNVLAVIPREGGRGPNITVAPRAVLSEIGGWRDLQYGEDWDVWSRAAAFGKYSWTVFPLVDRSSKHERRQTKAGKFKYRFGKYRDELRLGRDVLSKEEKVTSTQRAALLLARLALPFYESYANDFNKTFDCAESRHFVDRNTLTEREAKAA